MPQQSTPQGAGASTSATSAYTVVHGAPASAHGPPPEVGWFTLGSSSGPPAKRLRLDNEGLETAATAHPAPIQAVSAPTPELTVDDVLHPEYIAQDPIPAGTDDAGEEDEDEELELDSDGFRPVEYCVGVLFEEVKPGLFLCRLCRRVFDTTLRNFIFPYHSTPRARVERKDIDQDMDTILLNPSRAQLVDHCTNEHAMAWRKLREPPSYSAE
jgi:hypothetical protein